MTLRESPLTRTLTPAALRRWQRVAERPLGVRIRAGALVALIMGIAFSAMAVAVALLQGGTALRFRNGSTVPLAAVLAAYLVAGPVTGALFGALFRGTRTVVGAYAVGLAAGLPVAVAVVWGFAGGPPGTWSSPYWITGGILLATLGGIGGIIVRQLAAA